MRGIILALLLTLARSEKSQNDPLMAGATDNVFIMNSPTTTLPNAIISKMRGYVAGASTDLFEFGKRAEGLQEVLRKQNIPFNQNSMQKKMAKIVKTLTGFKHLPSEEPLLSTYVKLLGQEIFQNEATKETIQNAFRIKREPAARHSIINRKLLNGLVGQYAQPILLSEVRQIQPTSMGLPLELSIHSAAAGNAAVNLNMKANPTPSSDLNVAQLLRSNIQFHADITPSISVQTVASMGVNTHLVQPGTEFQSKIQAVTPAQFTAKFDDKENNVKVELEPNQQEKDLITARNQVFVVSRNVEKLEATKKTPVVPKGAEQSILQKHFEKSERASAEATSVMDGSSEFIAKKYSYPGVTAQHQALPTKLFHFCLIFPKINLHLCVQHQSHTAAGHRHTLLYQIVGQHEAKLTVKPTQKEVAIEKRQQEITAGPKAASKIIALADKEQKEDEHLEESEVQKRLKTILGIDDEHVRTIRTSKSSSSSSTSSNSASARRPQEKKKNFADVHNSVADRLKGHCLMTENMIKTFNDVNYNYTMPGHCYHVLAQDCTKEKKFLIMAKNSQENPEHKDINTKLGEFDVQMYSRSGEPMVKVNNIDVSKKKLPYEPSQDPSVHIEERDGKLVLSAPDFGIEELVYDRKSTELRTAVWMRGQTCGICGRHDDETGREFTMPDGSVAKDKESFGHSWILSEGTCSGACKLHRSLVKTEKPEREENKCYSIHPVLRCAKGCTPSATTPVSVGFHCTSADLAEDESMIDRSEDFTEQVEAHTSCSCKSLQCAA